MGKLFEELKRRKVIRVAAVYAVVAWVLIQVAATVLPALQLPDWTVTFITVLFILGFPIAVILAWAYDVTPEGIRTDGGRQTAPVDTSSSDHKLIYATFALVLLVAGFQITERFLVTGQPPTSTQSSLAAPSIMRAEISVDEQLARRFTGVRTQLAISPDGSQLLYGDMSVEGDFRIMLRNLETGETRVFSDRASLGTIPEFSPDGQNVLLNAISGFLVAPLAGGSPQFVSVADISGGAGSASNWFSDDEVLYTSIGSIFKKSLVTGAEEQLIASESINNFTKPYLLPGGEAILHTSNELSGRADFNDSIIELYDLASDTSHAIVRGGYLPRYASSGHIVFLRSGDIWAVPFNLDNLELEGREVKVIEGVDSQPLNGMASFTFSESGRLVYLAGPEIKTSGRPFNWIDRFGNEEAIAIAPARNVQPALSPDGNLLAFTVIEGANSRDIYIYDFSRQSPPGRRTFTEDATHPIWHPDGDKLVFGRLNNGIWLANADGTGQPQQILDTPRATPYSFSKNNRELIYGVGPRNSENLRTLVYRDSTWISSPLIDSNAGTWGASVSPDGRWIAYTNRDPGGEDIYVRPYPDTDSGGPWQISSDGGREPTWGPGSDELFYLVPPFGELMSVAINTDSGFLSDTPKILLTGISINIFEQTSYAVSPDGQRFILTYTLESEVPEDGFSGPATLTVVENWFEELKRLAPPDQN